MKTIDRAKLLLAIIGIVIWAFGARNDEHNLQWLGIAVIVIAFLMRFLPKERPPTG